ncbi:pyridoxal phosphate-dependent transferase [Penicillium cosmopolitanum]|uniref:Pyridoxal phosphate-dependent transferase n=1 Tax=Penicillium cosmopolitanum TaxID=1131564 RepID=A0A9W9VQ11_9EURO|nr:pyridoxal phosphate-dependent transferase [Penicillium cosmopolitanum]KAJ5387191.1 pyridoxal phosphate-dependent transferase [Penicillium cosmopolitanum]
MANVVNSTSAKLKISPTLEINELVSKARGEGKHVVHLGFGEATFPIQREVLHAHKEASKETSYMPVAGLEDLRTSIASFNADRLGVNISPDQVVVAPGSKPLLFALFDILDGAVLLPRPSWVSYEPQVLHAGKKLFWVETDAADRHTISESSLLSTYEKAVSEGQVPRIMLVNSPSNPTGHVFSASCVQTIKEFCKSKEIILITDEIYSDICFDESQKGISPFDSTTDDSETVILTGGLSKTYSAGGWRVGYAIFPPSEKGEIIRKTVLAYASECWSAASAPAQFASIKAFSTSEDMCTYRKSVTALHRYCTLKLYSALKELGLDVGQPGGAFYVYPSFSPYSTQLNKLGIITSADLSAWLIRECGLAALPGSAFGEDDNGPLHGRFRLRMATSYLYFQNEVDRYEEGYDLLKRCASGEEIQLPYLEEAIKSLGNAVWKLKNVRL